MNAILLHGTGCSPDMYWFPYVKKHLEAIGYDVWAPALPNPNEADINDWLPFVMSKAKLTPDTVLIGHSAGGPLILSILEKSPTKIKQAILVSAFLDLDSKILQQTYDWEKIKNNVADIIFINSDDNPWGCNDAQGRKLFDKLGGTQIVLHGQGHMGSTSYNQPYKEFPLIIKLVNGSTEI